MATLVYSLAHCLVALEFYLEFPFLFSHFGLLALGARNVVLFALPVASFTAMGLWTHARLSRRIIVAGWAIAFLSPVLLSFVPPHSLFNWDVLDSVNQRLLLEELSHTLGIPVAIQVDPANLRAILNKLFDMVGGVVYGALLLPTMLSIIPGVFRGCLRIKALLPQSTLPGWSMVTVAPMYSFGFLVMLVVVYQAFSNWLLLSGAFLLAMAPLVYVVRASLFLRPLEAHALGRQFRAVQLVYVMMVGAAVALLVVYLCTREIHLFGRSMRLVGLSEETSFMQPWGLLQFGVEYLARALFVTVVVADIVLRMQSLVWVHTKAAAQSATATEHDEIMRSLSKTVGGG